MFIDPLRDPKNNQVITAEERKGIFSELEVILGFNKGFLEQLEARMKEWAHQTYFEQCIGDIFKAIVRLSSGT